MNGLRVTNVYDTALRRATNGLWNGSTWLVQSRFAYDNASRLQSVTDLGNDSATYSYVANSMLPEQIVFRQNGVTRLTTTREYDGLNRLTNIVSVTNGATVASFGYRYNAANQRDLAKVLGGSYWVYTYDSLGQVTSGKKYRSDGTPVAGQQFEYNFDHIGNRSGPNGAKTGGDHSGANLRAQQYTPDSLNRYSSRVTKGSRRGHISTFHTRLDTKWLEGILAASRGGWSSPGTGCWPAVSICI